MAGRIKRINLYCIEDLISLKDVNGKKLFKFVNIWDSQIDELIQNNDNKGYPFNFPSAFVEIELGPAKSLGAKMTSYPEAIIRIHVFTKVLDGGGGTMDRNIVTFDNVDDVKTKFNGRGIQFCSTLQPVEEVLDYKHGSIYKHVVGFSTMIIDNSGSIFDTDKSKAVWAILSNPTVSLGKVQKFYVKSNLKYISQNGMLYVYSGL